MHISNICRPRGRLDIEHIIKFTVYSSEHSTPWSSFPAIIYLISIHLMLHFPISYYSISVPDLSELYQWKVR
jgi:hypothetical protein